MPTYDYQCDACGHRFEEVQSMRDDALTVCPSCNEAALRRLITGGTGVIFKGSGFYVTDSKNKKTSASSGAAASSGKTDESGC
jgi:putative FmdB family regulatory protein